MNNDKYADEETMRLLEARGYKIKRTETFFEGMMTPFSVITHRPALTEIVDWLWDQYGRFVEIHLSPDERFFGTINRITEVQGTCSFTTEIKYVSKAVFHTPDEALQHTIQICLKRMIKKTTRIL